MCCALKTGWLCVILFSLSLPLAAHADIVNIDASRDNALFSESPSFSNGAGEFLYIGQTNDNFSRRSLVYFNINAAVPFGATINSVTLQMNVSRVKDNNDRTAYLHPALKNWGEAQSNSTQGGGGKGVPALGGDATWSHYQYPDSSWASAGGDYNGTASASTLIGNVGGYAWTSAQMAADVQGWLDAPATNMGWFILGEEGLSGTAKRLDSRENTTIANRPVLVVDYTPPAGTFGACCLPDFSCVLASAADCATLGGDYDGDGTSCDPDPCALPSGTVILNPTKDNTMYDDGTGLTSNGAGQSIVAGFPNNLDVTRGLIAFEAVADSVPPGAVITSAILRLYNTKGGGGGHPFAAHKVLTDWGEGTSDASGGEDTGAAITTGDASWTYTYYPGSTWTSPGGDYVGAASASITVQSTGFHQWSSSQMAADVQGWVDSPASNFGWILIGNETTGNTNKRFDSRQGGTPGQWPQLEINYTILPPDPTGACCFNDGSCADTTEAACLSMGGTYQGDATACSTSYCEVVLEPFVDALPIPSLATPISGSPGGTASYEIPIQEFSQQLHRDLPPTRLWGYSGQYLGPTILAGRNQPVSVTWINDLRDTTGAYRTDHYLPVELCVHGPNHNGNAPLVVTHLHGGHVPAAVDGHPDSSFAPGEQRTYVYPNNQQAATLWYHDHTIGITRLNVMMGMAGAYVLTDSVDSAVDLPSGAYDVPLVMQDRKFNPDGTLNYPANFEEHFFGDKMLVNGMVWPYLNVDQGKYRFRMLNGCNSRFLELYMSDGTPMTMVGTDGGLLDAPVVMDTLLMSPGERFEMVIDFAGHAPGTEIILKNNAPIRYPGTPGEGVIPNVIKFIVQGNAGHTNPVPGSLRPVPAIPGSLSVMTRDLILDKEADPCAGARWTINGLGWDDLTEIVNLGDTEVWRFVNRSGISHPMHIHLVMYQIIERGTFTMIGDSVAVTGMLPMRPTDVGWQDTSPVGPNEYLSVIATFDDYPGIFVYHCHILEHEDHEMMRQFEVIDPLIGVPDDDVRPTMIMVQNHPNPFGTSTSIRFALTRRAPVKLAIYDVNGRQVRELVDTVLEGREHSILWDGRDDRGNPLSAGVYFLRLAADQENLTRKMVIVK